MKTGNDVLQFAKTLIGRPYVLGAIVPKDDPKYSGAFDCAEFVAYTHFQVFGLLYGCDSNAVKHAKTADAYTGYFKRDAQSLGEIITVAEAVKIRGAMILRFPAPGAVGHIVFSQGNGRTVEANSTKYGCIESVVTDRRFDIGILLPGIQYGEPNADVVSSPPASVFRYKTPAMVDPFIGKLQKALDITADNIFGLNTLNAVVKFQKENGLITDGEIMPGGQTAKALGI